MKTLRTQNNLKKTLENSGRVRGIREGRRNEAFDLLVVLERPTWPAHAVGVWVYDWTNATKEKDEMSFLSIDPGFAFGWALWSDLGELQKVGVVPVPAHLKKPNVDWTRRYEWTQDRFFEICNEDLVDDRIWQVVIELPQFFNTAQGQAVAGKGDLGKLMLVVGAMAAIAHGGSLGLFVRFAPVIQWKGQLPKSVVEKRIRKILGASFCEEMCIKKHGWDAVGIGLWHQGRF